MMRFMTVTTSCFNIADFVRFQVKDEGGAIEKKLLANFLDEYMNYRSAPLDDRHVDFILRITRDVDIGCDCVASDDRYYFQNHRFRTQDKYKIARWILRIDYTDEGTIVASLSPNLAARMLISGFFLDFLVQHCAVRKGIAVIHSSGVSNGENAFLFSGRGGSGKTTIAIEMVERGYRFLGDDFLFLDNGVVFPYLTPLNLFSYNLAPSVSSKLGTWKSASLLAKGALYRCTAGYVKLFTKLNPKTAFPGKIGATAALKNLFVMIATTSPVGKIEEIDRSLMIEYIVRNQMMDSKFMPKYILAYSTQYPRSRLANHWELYRKSVQSNIPLGLRYHRIHYPLNRKGKELVMKSVLDICGGG